MPWHEFIRGGRLEGPSSTPRRQEQGFPGQVRSPCQRAVHVPDIPFVSLTGRDAEAHDPLPDRTCARHSETGDCNIKDAAGGPPDGHGPPTIKPGERRQDCSRERPGFSSSKFCAGKHLRKEPIISGPKYFVPDIQYAPSDVDPADIVPFREEAFEGDLADGGNNHSVEGHAICISSWNLAGASEKRVKRLLSHVPCCDVLAVQEFPSQKSRWQILKGEVFHAVLFQDILMYRAVGIFYKPELFRLKKRVSTSKGIWFRLQHKPSQKHIWVGSVHLPNNEPRDEINRLADDFFKAGKSASEQAFAMGDYNIQFKWTAEAGEVIPGHITAKWGDLRRIATEAGFLQVAPQESQMNLATFHSSKGNVASTQIDGAFISNSPTPAGPTSGRPEIPGQSGQAVHQTSFIGSKIQGECGGEHLKRDGQAFEGRRGLESVPPSASQRKDGLEGEENSESCGGLEIVQTPHQVSEPDRARTTTGTTTPRPSELEHLLQRRA